MQTEDDEMDAFVDEEEEEVQDDQEDQELFGGVDEEIEEKKPQAYPSGKATPIIAEEEYVEKKAVDYKTELIRRSEVVSLIQSKVLDLQKQFDFANVDKGVFWKSLSENNYIVGLSARKLEDKIFDIMEVRTVQKLDPSKKYYCPIIEDEFDYHEVTHLGCGHTFHKDCFKQYLDQEIATHGKNSITSTCPHSGCPFQITEEAVS